jgi:hypothetical protein
MANGCYVPLCRRRLEVCGKQQSNGTVRQHVRVKARYRRAARFIQGKVPGPVKLAHAPKLNEMRVTSVNRARRECQVTHPGASANADRVQCSS